MTTKRRARIFMPGDDLTLIQQYDLCIQQGNIAKSVFWPSTPAFVSVASVYDDFQTGFSVPLSISRLFTGLFEMYHDVIVHLATAESQGFTIVFDIEHPDVTALFGEPLESEWLLVKLYYNPSVELELVTVLFDRAPQNQEDFEWVFSWPVTAEEIRMQYQHLTRPLVQLLYVTDDKTIKQQKNTQSVEGWFSLESSQFEKRYNGASCLMLNGPHSSLNQQLAAIDSKLPKGSYKRTISQLDHKIDIEEDKLVQRWMSDAWQRWPFHYQRVLSLCLATFGFCVPPYVLLEIVDWLPRMWRWKHAFKINCIVSIFNSMRKVIRDRSKKN